MKRDDVKPSCEGVKFSISSAASISCTALILSGCLDPPASHCLMAQCGPSSWPPRLGAARGGCHGDAVRCGERRDGTLLLLCDTHASFSLPLSFLLRHPRSLDTRSSSSYSQHPGVYRQGPAVWGEVGSPSISSKGPFLSNMTPSSAQLLGQSTIRSLRANVVGIRTRSCARVPMGGGGLRGICLSSPFCPVKGPVTDYGTARHGAVLVVGHHARSIKKSPRPRRL
jgi:hypothetical protein